MQQRQSNLLSNWAIRSKLTTQIQNYPSRLIFHWERHMHCATCVQYRYTLRHTGLNDSCFHCSGLQDSSIMTSLKLCNTSQTLLSHIERTQFRGFSHLENYFVAHEKHLPSNLWSSENINRCWLSQRRWPPLSIPLTTENHYSAKPSQRRQLASSSVPTVQCSPHGTHE